MPTHKNRLEQLSIRQLAWLARRAHETASRMLAEAGLQPVRIDGRTVYYDPRDALPILLGVGDGLNPQAERARLDRARAELAEHQLAERRGEYVAGAAIDEWIMRLASAFASSINSLPTRLAAEVRAASSDAVAEALLRTACDEALTALADAAHEAAESVERRKKGKA